MAEVFLATYSPEGGFERKVAVKRILPSFAQDPTAVALFRREAELGATLAHPNLVHVLDFGSDGETFFLAMELVEGCTLANVYDATKSAGRPLEPTAIAYIAWCLAEALDHLHEHVSPTGAPLHLVHRDINPPNVLVSVAGDVKLADFGIVRDLSAPNLTEFGVMRGKLAYAAPEQALGDRFDGRADLFALGITLWELSAGRRLFRADGDVSLLRAVLDEPIIPLGPLRRDLPPSFERIVMDLLERDLDRRTASARRLLQQLSALGTDVLDVREGRRLLAAWVEAGRVEKARVPPLASPSVAATAAETVTRTVGPT